MTQANRICAFVAVVFTNIFGYEESLPNLLMPSTVSDPSIQVVFQHRFTRGIGEPSPTLLGGATVNTGISADLWKGLGASFDFFTPYDEVDLGGSYSGTAIKRLLSWYGTAHVINFQENLSQTRVTSSFFSAAFMTNPLIDRLWITGNITYDTYNLLVVPSAGTLVRIHPKLDWTMEYCFTHDTSSARRNAFSLGITYNTWRHQFRLLLSNATGIGARHFIAGARDNRLRIGFSIERLFDFK
jgi:hypothetical protein